ncbi:MAG: L-fucose/L-arabinose isomerase family protein [Anaerolineae bacterium]|nr:L-fucose/L-arabinose isomerase family protein [Anaerolineae bacterium]
MKHTVTLGLIVGNRGFFPSHLCEAGRETVLEVLRAEGIEVVALGPEDTEYGSVESLSDAHKCAELFKAHREDIDGILVTLPNFGDERGIANTLRFADLNVPVLVHAFPDEVQKMSIQDRRDSFCGKMSACNNLRQYGIPFSLTTLHTVDPTSDSFRADLHRFAAVCRVVRGMRRARFGMLGARPVAFNTVRFSEKLLEHAGITVETLDLSEAFGRIAQMADDDARVTQKIAAVKAYANTAGLPETALIRIAKLGVMIDEWVATNQYDATAIQCWTSMQEFFGVVPCTLMSMLSESLAPSACETDIAGTAAMYAMRLASGQPSALLDWNNNYGDDPNKAVVFHCSNLPRSIFTQEIPVMYYQEIIAGSVGKENTWGALYGRIRPEPFTYLRISTDDLAGHITAYVGQGRFTGDPLQTFGGFGVVEIPRFQELLQHICEHGFEHHVAVNLSPVADAVHEAMTKYLGWSVYYHR